MEREVAICSTMRALSTCVIVTRISTSYRKMDAWDIDCVVSLVGSKWEKLKHSNLGSCEWKRVRIAS